MPYSGVTVERPDESLGAPDGATRTLHICDSCAHEWAYEEDAQNCCVFYCENCESSYDSEEEADNCCERYSCPGCGETYFSQEAADDCCYEPDQEEDYPEPEFDRRGFPTVYPPEVLDIEPQYLLYIPAIEGRPARSCSVEQELCSGGAPVARMLYDLGISEYDHIQSYSRDTRYPMSCIVKQDSSLPGAGGEVVYSRFLLSEPEHYQKFSKAHACIRELRNREIVSTTTAAGTHIHIGAMDQENQTVFGPAQMAALYEIHCFAEEVLFRIAAAGWDQHRGTGHARLLQKFGKNVTAGKVARNAQRDRHFSLNFMRLLDAARACSCGSCISGDWDECECGVMERGTVEWRVFNATTNPRTLHAWLLLAHGLTAAAFNHQLGTLEPNEWQGTNPEKHPWILGWILNNCAFLDEEKQVIMNTAKRAPGLEIDWDDFEKSHGGWGQLEIPETPPLAFPLTPKKPDPALFANDYEGYDRAVRSYQQAMQQMQTTAASATHAIQWATNNTTN